MLFPRQYDLNHLKKSNIVNKASSTTSRNTKPFQTLLKLSFYSYVSNKSAYHDLMMDLVFLPKQNSHFKYKKSKFLGLSTKVNSNKTPTWCSGAAVIPDQWGPSQTLPEQVTTKQETNKTKHAKPPSIYSNHGTLTLLSLSRQQTLDTHFMFQSEDGFIFSPALRKQSQKHHKS